MGGILMDIFERIHSTGIIPVVKIDDEEKAIPLANALKAGGINCAEITFRTSQARKTIEKITEACPDMLVGAGTVLTTEQAEQAVAAGAQFIVSPGFNPEVVRYCVTNNIPIVPGCSNPSDIEMAMSFGLNVVKFFPAEASGGVNYIKAISAPYKNIKFVPTGGISEKNLNDYLSLPQVLACGGSWMVKDEYINSGNFEKITELCKEAVRLMLGFELAHIGINCENPDEAGNVAQTFSMIFGFEYKEGNSSIFSGKVVEAMKTPFRGRNGHIAFSTNSVARAIAYMESIGVKVDHDSAKRDKNGAVTAVYLNHEIGGFAVHLIKK